jgi:GNAT superfamily N-acetyltransferase
VLRSSRLLCGDSARVLEYTPDTTKPLIQQLGDRTSSHLRTMQTRLNRPDERTFFCMGLTVLPSHQSRGVGSALLSWVTDSADESGASFWIHLSDSPGVVKALERKGFVEVNRLEVDLDQYAEKPRGDGGTYTFRYMRREAKT